MNHIEQTLVEIATAALVRAGHGQSSAKVIALETLADHIIQQSIRIRDNAKFAEGKTYYREIREADELLSRANNIMAQAAELRKEAE